MQRRAGLVQRTDAQAVGVGVGLERAVAAGLQVTQPEALALSETRAEQNERKTTSRPPYVVMTEITVVDPDVRGKMGLVERLPYICHLFHPDGLVSSRLPSNSCSPSLVTITVTSEGCDVCLQQMSNRFDYSPLSQKNPT